METLGRVSAGPFCDLEVIRVQAGIPTPRIYQLVDIQPPLAGPRVDRRPTTGLWPIPWQSGSSHCMSSRPSRYAATDQLQIATPYQPRR